MSSDILSQMKDLRKVKWLDLNGLVTCVTAGLSKPDQASCTSISLLGRGSYNTVYKLAFSDSSSYAVSVPHDDEEDFVPAAKQSEIATMSFVRNSGLYSEIPVPQVYSWDLTFTNLAGAPYVVMEYIDGIRLDQVKDGFLWGLDTMSPTEQLSVVKGMAKLQASLSKPVPFDQIGSLTQNNDGSFAVGELGTGGALLGGPYKTVSHLWRTLLEHQVLHALEEWHSLETEQLSQSMSEPHATPQQFSQVLQLLSALIPYFIPPTPYTPLVLHHPDIALRNILFDPEDHSKVIGILDWGGAQILPLMLTAQFPGDLNSEGGDPCTRPDYPDENWCTVPHDWTCFGDTSKWPAVYKSKNEPVDLRIRARAMIKRYYLRQCFSASYVEQMAEMHQDHNLARATLFADAPYYLKFHEVLSGSWMGWIKHEAWIKETYWRLLVLGPKPGAVVIGPNTYRGSAKELVCDLNIYEPDERTEHKEGDCNS
ncbi:kinase-like domain-containing protein [Gautieria morchelliformis]|nr:kinase-like domain-containing protein [Gautieria morchelliformis]